MKYDPELISKYLWMVLVVVIILAAVVIIFLPGIETKSVCSGFQYFLFLDQKLTTNEYSVELLNGRGDVIIKSVTLEDTPLGPVPVSVKAGERIMFNSTKDPTLKSAEDTFRYRIAVEYDFVGGIQNNKDTAVCTGKVQ